MSFSPVSNRRLNGRINRRELSPTPTHGVGHRTRTPSPNPPQNNRPSRPKREISTTIGTSEPLLEPDVTNNPHPPLAGEEIDDIDSDERDIRPQPGVDDGFTNSNPDVEMIPPNQEKRPVEPFYPENGVDESDIVPGYGPRINFPYAPDFGPTYGTEFGTDFIGTESIPDVNVYQHKKTLAQGMMDLALFSANASQLRYVLESKPHPYFFICVFFISISLLLQVLIGVGLIWNSRYNVKDKKEICIANKVSNFTIVGIFLVTAVNVFISAFGVSTPITTNGV